ncbi:hypothetical protein [Methanobrevibacter sp.]|uniref:hypothetical protein n=1 Tax=Methanobrevibacter sp. TaxID=66852 RepID=UPI00388D2445
MNKKLITTLFIAAFLLASIGFVSASDNGQGINVKISWDDTSSSDRPAEVVVSLIKDGIVVETSKLNASNSWSATFENQDSNGDYSIQVNDISNYQIKKSGNANDGFVIAAKINTGILGATENENPVEQTDVSETPVTQNISVDDTIPETTNSSDNQTDNSTDDSNSTDDETEETTEEITTTTTTTKVVSTVEKENAVKKPVKKEQTNHTLRNTGLPIALVLAAIAAIFIPIAYKKK